MKTWKAYFPFKLWSFLSWISWCYIICLLMKNPLIPLSFLLCGLSQLHSRSIYSFSYNPNHLSFLYFEQCYLLVYYTSWRNVKSFLTFGLICLCNMYLYELRNLWQLFFHVTVGAFVTLQIWLRQAQGKAPDYDVWHHPSDLLPWLLGEKEGAYLNCHCDEETVHHKREALLSSSPTVLFVLSQHGMPVSMQYLPGKLLSEECWPWGFYSEEKTSLCRAVKVGDQSDAIGRHDQQSWILTEKFSQKILIFWGLSRNSTTWVCLCEALV